MVFDHDKKRKYVTFNYPGAVPGSKTLLTGVREINPINKTKQNKVYITGFYTPAPSEPNQTVKSFVYKGYLYGNKCREKGKWYELYYPNSPTTNLYGPNNGPKKGTIQVVGNYTVEKDGQTVPVGCLYEGKLDGSGKWTSLTPVFNNEEVLGVIAHSNMGGLVVGNYDTQKDEGKAFIYDIKKKIYHKIEKEGAISITAYGIWYNGGNSYTICGGYKDSLNNDNTTTNNNITNSEAGYLVDWDNKRKLLSNWRSYHYDNDPVKSRITHFDGITGSKDGYNLTGDWLGGFTNNNNNDNETKFGFFAAVKRNKCGKFTRAKWESIKYPSSDETSITSGNTVYKKDVIGVYTTEVGVNGYIAFN